MLARYRSAAGAARLERLTSLVAEGTSYHSMIWPAGARFVFRYRAPATFQRIEVLPNAAEGPIIFTLHRGEGWIRGVTPSRPTRDRIGWRPGEPIHDTRLALRRIAEVALGLLPSVLIDRGLLRATAVEPGEDQGRRLWRVDVGDERGAFGWVAFWDATALPAHASLRYLSILPGHHEYARAVEYKAFRAVEGLRLPSELRWSPRQWIVITRYVVNAPLPEDLFRLPASDDDVARMVSYRPPARR